MKKEQILILAGKKNYSLDEFKDYLRGFRFNIFSINKYYIILEHKRKNKKNIYVAFTMKNINNIEAKNGYPISDFIAANLDNIEVISLIKGRI